MMDLVWEHGEKTGSVFRCKYCREAKSGGGATRLKEHLEHQCKHVKNYPFVPLDRSCMGMDNHHLHPHMHIRI
jgi:hypothetical protein